MSRKYLSITKGLFPNNHWDVNFWKHMRYEQSQYSTVVNGTLQINTHLYITTSCLLLQDRYLCQYYLFIKNVCLSPQLGDDNIMEISFETILNTGTSRVIYRANLKQGQFWRASTRASQKVLTNVSTYVEVFVCCMKSTKKWELLIFVRQWYFEKSKIFCRPSPA